MEEKDPWRGQLYDLQRLKQPNRIVPPAQGKNRIHSKDSVSEAIKILKG